MTHLMFVERFSLPLLTKSGGFGIPFHIKKGKQMKIKQEYGALCITLSALAFATTASIGSAAKEKATPTKCMASEFFDTSPKCGASAIGTCKSKPQICTDEFKPVKGCDGKTYPNKCSAAQAGVSVEDTGSNQTRQCKQGEYLNTAPSCEPNAPGKCVVKPQICTKEFAPVMGCDGKQYSNKCEAAAVGITVSGKAIQQNLK